ncbi:assimilatory nitrate reductase NasA [Halarchaeum salinum]|uniref:4Fe-4S Mo/W bis-MGD-type domain-containing protein n=1 Tax=Halarchaeum salinum TaxID=489912 RepID=A0AAV3S8D0_9EURY
MTGWVPTTCMRCAVGCGHLQRGADLGNGVDSVRGNADHPTNRGLACQRGVSETADPDGTFLTRPLVRRDGELVPTTWDVAVGKVTEAMRTACERDPDSIGVLGSGQQTNEAAYALGKAARGAIGTRHYDANTTLCMSSAVAAYYDAFGSDAPPCSYEDIPAAESHVVWGANPAVAHPVLFRWVTDSARDGELIVVDPVETDSAEAADVHVQPDPGADLTLARAVLAHVVETGRVDEAFVDAHTEGFAAACEDLPEVEAACEAAGVERSDVEALADALDAKTLLYWGMGVNQSTRGTATAGALIDLCLATGNLGEGTGPFSLTGQANSMGTRVCSSKGGWPGMCDYDDPTARARVAEAWGVDVERLPDDSGPGPVGMFADVGESIEVLWTVATNPAAGLPDADDAAAKLDDVFLVAQDAFHTETVEYADVVLPAATWGESEGTTTNMERAVSRVRAVTDLPAGVRTDLDIIATVANGVHSGTFDRHPEPEAVFEEMTALTAGTPADCSGLSYERLDDVGAVRWPAPDAETSVAYRYRDGDGWTFETVSENAQFSTGAPDDDLPEPTSDAYPLTLTTGRESDGYNTGVRSRGGDTAVPTVRANPADASDGDRVSVETRRGSAAAVVATDPAVPAGVVWLSIHHPATNRLTLPAVDPRSAEPNYKQCATRLVPRTDGADAVETSGAGAASEVSD